MAVEKHRARLADTRAQSVAYLIPFLLLATMVMAFYFLPKFLGQKPGYFFSFLFYWLFWCFIVPVSLTGWKAIANLFRIRKPFLGLHPIRNLVLLSLPVALAYGYQFPKVVDRADALLIITSFALSLINATAEEVLWRGTFLRLLGNTNWYVLYSSLGFAVWHFAPQIVFANQNPGGSFSFVAAAFLLGLFFSSVARETKSISFVVVSHILFDFAGLGGRLYFSVS